jgi:hypothetical protein
MTVDKALIEQIVAHVMGKLVTDASSVRSKSTVTTHNQSVTDASEPSNGHIVVTDAVVTAAVLKNKLAGASKLVLAEKSILTPSAQDFLRSRRLQWSRQANGADNASSSTQWRLIAVQTSATAKKALEDIDRIDGQSWDRATAASDEDALRQAVKSLSQSEANGVVIVTDRAAAICCQANRNTEIRAAVAFDVQNVAELRSSLGPNVLAVNPAGRTRFEMKNLLRAAASGGSPEPPSDWKEL